MQTQNAKHTTHIQVELSYRLYLPENTPNNEQYPVILFLHGAGERENDLSGVIRQPVPRMLEEGYELPFIVIAPQCPPEQWWASYTSSILGILDDVLANYPADPGRVYLTGLSMGGFGTWHLATREPERFAAIMPICGFTHPLIGNFPEALRRITHIPVWAFHGAKDPIVPIEASQFLIDKLKEYGGNPRFTVYPEGEHDVWTETYKNPEIYDWLLQQRRKKLAGKRQ